MTTFDAPHVAWRGAPDPDTDAPQQQAQQQVQAAAQPGTMMADREREVQAERATIQGGAPQQ